MGLGTATVVGASMVVSSPAFAYDQPTAGAPATMSVTSTGNTATVNINDGTATCPGSAPSTSATALGRSTLVSTVNPVPVSTIFGTFPTEFRLGNIDLPQTTTAASFQIQKFGSTLGFAQNFVNGDVFNAVISVTFRCTYSDSTTRDRTVQTTRTATRGATAWTVV
jgi:hypothetical protein